MGFSLENNNLVGTEVLTEVVMKSSVFITLLATSFHAGLYFEPQDGGKILLRNVC
jgi:hypothetical protein